MNKILIVKRNGFSLRPHSTYSSEISPFPAPQDLVGKGRISQIELNTHSPLEDTRLVRRLILISIGGLIGGFIALFLEWIVLR